MPRSFLVKQHEKPQETERTTGIPREAEKDSVPSLPPPLLKVSPRTSSQRAWVPMDDRPVPKLVKIESTSTKPLNSAFEFQTNSIKHQVKKDLHDTFSSIRDSQMRCQLSMVELSPKEVWMCQSSEATKPRHPSFVDDIRRGSYANAGYFREYFDTQCFSREEERYLHRPHHVDMAKKHMFPPFYPGSVSNGAYCLASSPMFASENGIYPSSIYGNMSFLGSKANEHNSPSRRYEPEYQTNLPVIDQERVTAENVIEHVAKDEAKLFPEGKQVKQDSQSATPVSSSNNDQGKPQLESNQSGASLNTLNAMVTKETTSAAENITTKAQSTAKKYRYTCDVCGKSFSRSNTLTTHKRIHTGDKPFHCEQCGRAFRQPGNLTRHRLTHTAVKPYVCPQCNKAFNRASNLHTHMRTHTNYKPFVCDFCGKGFHQKIDMKIHRYTHTGEKPHKCNKCGRGFKQLTHLTYHMRTHSDERLYKCDYCGKGFNQKGNLQAHIYGHTGERPFKCDICDKGFTLASTLNTHKRTHAMKKPFECQFCGKAFYQKNALKTHYIASHPFANGVSLL